PVEPAGTHCPPAPLITRLADLQRLGRRVVDLFQQALDFVPGCGIVPGDRHAAAVGVGVDTLNALDVADFHLDGVGTVVAVNGGNNERLALHGNPPQKMQLASGRHGKNAGYFTEQLLALVRVVAANGGRDTGVQVVVEHHRADFVQRRLDGFDLLDDVDAVGVVVHHALDAFEVAGGAGQSPAYVGPCFFVHHMRSPVTLGRRLPLP